MELHGSFHEHVTVIIEKPLDVGAIRLAVVIGIGAEADRTAHASNHVGCILRKTLGRGALTQAPSLRRFSHVWRSAQRG